MLFKVAAGFMIMLTTIQLFCVADDSALLKERFEDSCNEVKPEIPGAGSIDCAKLYDTFLTAFKGREPEDMMLPTQDFGYEGYWSKSKYFEEGKFPPTIKDNGFFWSATQDLQKKLVEDKADIVCGDTIFAMKVVDNMGEGAKTWCSNKNGEVYINTNCKSNHVSGVFWAEASKKMAQQVVGNSFYLTQKAIFGEGSYFNLYELSTLLKGTYATALAVLNVIVKGSKELCGTGNLACLQNKVKGKLDYQCYDVYGDAKDPSQALLDCLKKIIDAVVKGSSPSPDPCFSKL